MLYTVSFNHFNISIISLKWETHLVYSIAFLDLFQYTKIPFCEFGGLIKTFFNGAKKTVIV